MKTVIAAALLALAGTAFAQATPAGLWKTIDDETKQERSLVRISETGGVFSGKIEKISDASKADAKCDKCEGAKKDQPIVGMTIIEGAKKSADQAYWEGGSILDPNNGKTYKLRLTPKDGGKTLEVRGYIGAPMFGRTQTWQRVE
ncbi:MAG: DUF2147 domain-containing protein [Rhizobacter sp.]